VSDFLLLKSSYSFSFPFLDLECLIHVLGGSYLSSPPLDAHRKERHEAVRNSTSCFKIVDFEGSKLSENRGL
jgi:hypothetical protein